MKIIKRLDNIENRLEDITAYMAAIEDLIEKVMKRLPKETPVIPNSVEQVAKGLYLVYMDTPDPFSIPTSNRQPAVFSNMDGGRKE